MGDESLFSLGTLLLRLPHYKKIKAKNRMRRKMRKATQRTQRS